MDNKRTNMGHAQNQFYEDLQRRIKEAKGQLRKLSDDELMRIHEGLYDEPEGKQDAAFMAAIYNEVRRRSIAAGWLWCRLFRRQEHEKWVAHNNKTEAKARQKIINVLQKYDDPSSQEAIRRLKGEGKNPKP